MNRTKPLAVIALVASAYASLCAVGQAQAPSETDLAAAYCVGVLNEQDRSIVRLLCPDPNDQVALRGCNDARNDMADKRRRLFGYLTARGYLFGTPTLEGLQGLLIATGRGESDTRSCFAEHEARCGHCQATTPGTVQPFDSIDRMTACLKACTDRIGSCVRMKRCNEGPFLSGVP